MVQVQGRLRTSEPTIRVSIFGRITSQSVACDSSRAVCMMICNEETINAHGSSWRSVIYSTRSIQGGASPEPKPLYGRQGEKHMSSTTSGRLISEENYRTSQCDDCPAGAAKAPTLHRKNYIAISNEGC